MFASPLIAGASPMRSTYPGRGVIASENRPGDPGGEKLLRRGRIGYHEIFFPLIAQEAHP
jgi:hypothetical protein